jgi:hypothetical protein
MIGVRLPSSGNANGQREFRARAGAWVYSWVSTGKGFEWFRGAEDSYMYAAEAAKK